MHLSPLLNGHYALTLTGPGPEGFAHDCLVAGTRRTVGLTFYEITDADQEARRVQGRVSALVWMPQESARALYCQLGEVLKRLEGAREDEVVQVDHALKRRTMAQ